MPHSKDRLERSHAIVEKLWANKSRIGLNEQEWAVLINLVDAYTHFGKIDAFFPIQSKSELDKFRRLINKKIVDYDAFEGGLKLTDLEKQELQNVVENEGMAKGGVVKEWIAASSDRVAYPKLRTPDKRIWTKHSEHKTREDAEHERASVLVDEDFEDAKILDLHDETMHKVFVYVTGKKKDNFSDKALCTITIIENGKPVKLNCFTEEEKKETFEEIKKRNLPIISVKDNKKMSVGGDTADTIQTDVPLFIRLLEYAKEDAKTDMDLHKVAENAIEISKENKTLTMGNYDSIVNINNKKDFMAIGGSVNNSGINWIITGNLI